VGRLGHDGARSQRQTPREPTLAPRRCRRRKRRRGLGALKASSGLRVLESTRLGPKAALVTAAVGRRVILLGVTDQTISKLGWLPADDDDTDAAPADTSLALALPAASREPEREPSRQAATVESKTKRGARPSDGTFAAKLRTALGASPTSSKSDDALAASAQLTRDVVDLRRTKRRAPAAEPREDDAMIDVEAQAAGLIRRLKGKNQ
jgi:flagellar biogenesis protein FliO